MTKHIWFMDGHCEEDVMHYGVKGMKWGVIRSRKPSGTKRKAAVSTDNGTKSHPLHAGKSGAMTSAVATVASIGISAGIIVGINVAPIVTAASLAAIGITASVIAKIKAAKQKHEYDAEYGMFDDGPVTPLENLRRMKPEATSVANKECNYTFGDPGRMNNCINCSVALEMRCRGYDVTSRRHNKNVTATNAADLFFKDAEYKRVPLPDDIEERPPYSYKRYISDAIRKEGDARGFVAVEWACTGAAHSFNYECKKGKVTFYDSQQGLSGKDVSDYFEQCLPTYMKYMRTDDKELKPEAAEVVIESGADK